MRFGSVLVFVLSLWVVGCGTDDTSEVELPPEHTEPADFEEVPELDGKGDSVPAVFSANEIVTDKFYSDKDIVDGDTLQAFFEATPYGGRSWLADETIDGRRAADLVVDAAQEYDVNPIMLLVRLQVEQGLVSKTVRPSQRKIDRALGCGCFDGQSCSSSFLGFGNQMRCGAETHRKLFGTSEAGNGNWVKGKTRSTLDGIRVRPVNHATAALYGYTPWVLRGRGGNWLVWNITKKFVRHLEDTGAIVSQKTPFVGAPCTSHSQCEFQAGGEDGFCFDFEDRTGAQVGFCTVVCSGGCPDKTGEATTFCIDSGVQGLGVCASKPAPENNQCADIPGTLIEERQRFTDGGTSTTRSDVCAPDSI